MVNVKKPAMAIFSQATPKKARCVGGRWSPHLAVADFIHGLLGVPGVLYCVSVAVNVTDEVAYGNQ
jgi:hypothetical protein